MKEKKFFSNNESAEQMRINRIDKILDRLDRIPRELDEINEKLYNPGGFTRDEYARLEDRRGALYIEQERLEKEAKEVYHLKGI